MTNNKPDLICGIDFGTTCTGVAYVNLSGGSKTVKWIQKWPGRTHVNENKVKTLLAYEPNNAVPAAWGFLTEKTGSARRDDLKFREYFKIFLDPKELQRRQDRDPHNTPRSMDEVETWYEDYLRCLYNHISYQFSPILVGNPWELARIEFVFSVPTTWTDMLVVERFRSIIRRAGFASHKFHSLQIGLTEAEAAAVHVSQEESGLFRSGDVMLTCDAGGGTTDLSVLRVKTGHDAALELEQIDVVNGRAIGSVAIDADFAKLVGDRLIGAHRTLSMNTEESDLVERGWDVSFSQEYQSMKCEFGAPLTENLSTFVCPLPWLDRSYRNELFGIWSQEIHFTREDFRAIFDKQIQKLFSHIDNQILQIRQKSPDTTIRYLILSGGLGNSAYVQQQLIARYVKAGSHGSPMTVRVAPDPQLAVCKGLVEDRLQHLISGRTTLTTRICRESYGVLCVVPVNPTNKSIYQDAETFTDLNDGKTYYHSVIKWLIKKGEPITAETKLSSGFFRNMTSKDVNQPYNVVMFVSKAEAHRLPEILRADADVQKLCTIVTSLAGIQTKEFEEKGRRSFFGRRGSNHHYVARFDVRTIIGPADLQFELWFHERRIAAGEAIPVQWS